MKKTRVFISSIGTAVPGYRILQEQMLGTVSEAVPDGKKDLIRRLYRNSGINERHSILDGLKGGGSSPAFIPSAPVEFAGPTTAERNALYAPGAAALAAKAVRALFEKEKSCGPESVTHLITASCTGFAAPGFDIELIREFGMRPDTARLNLGFMGCLAALPALRTAMSICAADAAAKVLVVCNELCSLHYRHYFDAETLVSNSLFADGCGAALVGSFSGRGSESGIGLTAFDSGLINGTAGDMGWMIGDYGFAMTLSPKVPGAVGANSEMMLEKVCRKAGIKRGDVRNWAVHPGGRAILDRMSAALGLEKEHFEASYGVLRDFGNMSSATELFVLERLLKSGVPGPVFAAAFGPGLAYETAIFEMWP